MEEIELDRETIVMCFMIICLCVIFFGVGAKYSYVDAFNRGNEYIRDNCILYNIAEKGYINAALMGNITIDTPEDGQKEGYIGEVAYENIVCGDTLKVCEGAYCYYYCLLENIEVLNHANG